MAGEKHLLLSIIGDWTDSDLSAEGWQVGIRLALVFGGVDDIGTLPNNWDPTATTINRTETDWTITGNWHAQATTAYFEPDDYLNDQAAPAVATWADRSATSNGCRVRALKLSPIGAPNGKLVPAVPYATGTPCLLTWTGSYPVGGNSGDLLPLQNAAVASHRTPQVGRTGRGRSFLPGLTKTAVDADSRINSTVQAGLLAAQVALLEGLAYTPLVGSSPQVRPIVTGKPWTRYGVINQVRVGNIMDTQRRRRRSLPETFSSASPSY
jgi:hypothetical protein